MRAAIEHVGECNGFAGFAVDESIVFLDLDERKGETFSGEFVAQPGGFFLLLEKSQTGLAVVGWCCDLETVSVLRLEEARTNLHLLLPF